MHKVALGLGQNRMHDCFTRRAYSAANNPVHLKHSFWCVGLRNRRNPASVDAGLPGSYDEDPPNSTTLEGLGGLRADSPLHASLASKYSRFVLIWALRV